jgi:uncharacterized cupin superfamily protein
MAGDAIDLERDAVHLGLGATAERLADFAWDGEAPAAYEAAHAGDGVDGRLVVLSRATTDWTVWERHPAGEELVVLLDGRMTLVQEVDGVEVRIPMRAGEAAVNPKGAWHTADVHEAGRVLYITPGLGTEHRPRS